MRPTDVAAAQAQAVEAATKAFAAKLESLDAVRDEVGQPYGDRLLSLVMLNVLDEKWKDHLYDLDQLRNAIHYRSWGQKDPLIEYKQEAYTMFVDLMNDIYNTFTERFLKVQLVFEQRRRRRHPPPPAADGRRSATTRSAFSRTFPSRKTAKPDGDRNDGCRGRHRSSGDASASRQARCRRGRIRRSWAQDVRGRSTRATGWRQAPPIGPRSDATIRARAGQARNSRSVMARISDGDAHQADEPAATRARFAF